MSTNFTGTGVALVTPFQADGSVDYKGLEKLLQHVASGGVDYLVVNGTTGEAPTLSQGEKTEVLQFVVDFNQKRLPVVFGFAGNNTTKLMNELDHVDLSSIDAILSANPYYNRPGQNGLIQHFTQLADHCPVPIILYNIPSRTGSNLTAATTRTLSQHANIIGVKEASWDLVQCMNIVANGLDDFLLLAGDDFMTLPMMAIGAKGVISVAANAIPQTFSDMVKHAANGNFNLASQINGDILGLMELLSAEGNPTGIKQALELLNVCSSTVRLPLVEASQSLREKLQITINNLA